MTANNSPFKAYPRDEVVSAFRWISAHPLPLMFFRPSESVSPRPSGALHITQEHRGEGGVKHLTVQSGWYVVRHPDDSLSSLNHMDFVETFKDIA